MIETNFSQVEISEILDTNLFNMENVLTSAGWFIEIEKDHEEVEHHHHNHNHHHSYLLSSQKSS